MEKEFKHIAIFDLDKTLYRKSSKVTFFLFLCRRNPFRVRYLFRMSLFGLLHKVGLVSRERYKQEFFCYLTSVPKQKLPSLVEQFWKREYPANFNSELLDRMQNLKKQKTGIFIITGTPEFLATPLKKKLGIDALLGTKLKLEKDRFVIKGKACNDKEKVKRLEEAINIKKHKVKAAFSDKEEPILKIAAESFLMENGKAVRFK